MTYFYPNAPNFIEPGMLSEFDRNPAYIAERKKNGWRCLAIKAAGSLLLWTRHHTLIPDPLPLTRSALADLPNETIIDGELIDRRTKGTKDTYYAFDILMLSGRLLFGLEWRERRRLLEKTVGGMDVMLSEPINTGKELLYALAIADGDEGIVLKNIHSRYIMSQRKCEPNPFWMKAKQVERSVRT